MSAQFVGYAMWFSSAALLTAICVFLWRNQMRARYPLFFAYCAFHVVSSVALFAIYRLAFEQYFFAYWTINALRVGLGFGVIYELFQNALRPYHALRDLGKMLFGWAAVVMLLVGVLIGMTGSAPNEASRVVAGVLGVERIVRLMQCGMLLFLLLFGSRLGLTFRHRTFGIAAGIGVYAATDLLFVSLRAQIGPAWETQAALLRQFVWIGACGAWLTYVLRPEPAREALPSMAAARPILQRWNEALAEAAAGYGSAIPRIDTPDPFTATVEQTVERVLRKEGNGNGKH